MHILFSVLLLALLGLQYSHGAILMMPLLPLVPGTNRAKKLNELTDAEKPHWCQQVLDEQTGNAQRGWPIDSAALAQAEAFAKGLDDQGLADRIAAARLDIKRGPQPVSEPSRGITSR
jgi:hypothetical protein